MVFCPNCGAPVEGKFCAKCGTAVTGAAGAAPPPPNPATPPGAQAYAPPPGAQPYAAGQPAQAGLQDNMAGALSYLVITAIIFLVMAPYNTNKFIRFHSFQAIFYWVAWVAFWIVWAIIRIAL